MSVVLVCLPSAPKVSEEAVRKDAELNKYLESRVEGENGWMDRWCKELIFMCKDYGIAQHKDLMFLHFPFVIFLVESKGMVSLKQNNYHKFHFYF